MPPEIIEYMQVSGTAASRLSLTLLTGFGLVVLSLDAHAQTLDLGGVSAPVANLDGYSLVTNSGSAAVLTIDTAGDTTYSGVIANGAGQIGVVKSGSGTLVLTGVNTQSGDTGLTYTTGAFLRNNIGNVSLAVTGGTLAINSGAARGGGVVAIDNATRASFGGAPITITNTILVGVTSGAQATFNTTGGDITVSSSMIGYQLPGDDFATDAGVIKTGSGTLYLTAHNYFNGGVQIQQGTVAIDTLQGLGQPRRSFTSSPVDLPLVTIEKDATLRTMADIGGGWRASVALGDAACTSDCGFANIAPDAGTTLVIDSDVTGPAGLNMSGKGTLYLTGAKSYTGGTQISSGALEIDDATAINASTLAIANGGRLTLMTDGLSLTPSSFTLNGLGIVDTNGYSATIGTVIADAAGTTGSFVKDGLGVLTLAAAATYTGSTEVRGGTLSLALDGALSTQTSVQVDTGATLDLGGHSLSIAGIGGDGTISGSVSGGGNGGLQLGWDGSSSTFSGVLTDGAGQLTLTKLGAGTLTLDGASSFSGGVLLNAGEIIAGNAAALGTGAVTMADATRLGFSSSMTLANALGLAGRATLDTGANAVTLSGVVSGSGALTKVSSGALTLDGTNTYSGGTSLNAGEIIAGNGAALGTGSVSIANGATLGFSASMTLANAFGLTGSATLDTAANAVTLSGAISGSGALTKVGAGTLTLTGVNSYSGGTFVDAGTLAIDSAQAIGSGSLNLADGATLDFLSTMTLANAVTFTGVGDPIFDTGSSTVTLSGAITGSGALTKLGTGTLILAGTDSYSGATLVSQGVLEVDGSIVSSTIVASGATLSGFGTVGAITVESGGALSPGTASQPYGTLRSTGSVSFASGSTYVVSLSSTGSSLLTTTGSASLAGTVLANWSGAATTSGSRYTILTASGGVSGTFGALTVTGLTTKLPVLAYDANNVYLVFNGLTNAAVAASVNNIGMNRLGALITNGVLASVLDGVNEQMNCDNCVSVFGSVGSLSAGMHGRLRLSDNFALLGGVAYSQYHSGGVAVTASPIFLAALRYDRTDLGASRPFAEIGASGSPWQRGSFKRNYDDAGISRSGTGVANAATYSAFGKLGWIYRWSPIDEAAAWAGLSRSWQIVGGYTEGGGDNPSPATVAAGTDRLNIARVGAQWTHLFGSLIETQISLAGAQSFDAQSGLTAGVLGLSNIHPQLNTYRWVEYGARVGLRFSENMVVDLYANGTLGGRPVGDTIHGGAGLRWAF